MSDQHLSGEEKRRLMKEQFKKELRERKAFQEKVAQLRKQQNITKALEDMNYEDDSQDWIDKLNSETAFTEAKVEMALESAHIAAAKAEAEKQLALDEEEMKKIAAEEMVQQMKEQIAAEAEGKLLNVEVDPESGETVEKQEPPQEEDVNRPRRGMMDGFDIEIG